MSDLGITLFDLVVGGIVLLSTLLALSRGAVREALGLLSWVGAVVAATYAFQPVRPLVMDAVGNDLLADAGTIAVVFLVPLVLLKIVTGLIARAVAGSALGPVDKALGLGFGFARGALIVCGAYLVGSVIVDREHHPDWIKSARLKPPVEDGADWLATLLPPGILDASKEAAGAAAEEAAARARDLRQAGDGIAYGEDLRRRMDDLVSGHSE